MRCLVDVCSKLHSRPQRRVWATCVVDLMVLMMMMVVTMMMVKKKKMMLMMLVMVTAIARIIPMTTIKLTVAST